VPRSLHRHYKSQEQEHQKMWLFERLQKPRDSVDVKSLGIRKANGSQTGRYICSMEAFVRLNMENSELVVN